MIVVDTSVWVEAIRRPRGGTNVTLKELLASYIEAGLRNPSIPKKAASPGGKHHALPVGIPRDPDAPLHPALSNAELNAILEAEDLAEYKRVIAQSSIPD